MDKWQPIETAPREGMQILGYDHDGNCVVVEFYMKTDGSSWWELGHSWVGGTRMSQVLGAQLTHWMPSPLPPQDSGEQ